MHKLLYLDTARLGQMSPAARDASIDFSRFANEFGSPLYAMQLLTEGFPNWPSTLRQQYPGLVHWRGVSHFKNGLRQIAGAGHESEILLASRTASLMKFAARLMTGPCRNILTTDTCWPAYKNILNHEVQRTGNRITEIPVREKILRQSYSKQSIIDFLVNEYIDHQCDGLFLPLIDNLGIRLPVRELVCQIRERSELRFVAVDGAQAIGHVPLNLETLGCDFFLGGSHKWLRAFYTMGFGFFGNPGSRDYIARSLGLWRKSKIVDDPMLSFSDELELSTVAHYGETVHIAPLLIANAVVGEFDSHKLESNVNAQADRKQIENLVANAGWDPITSCPELTSQILLARRKHNPEGFDQVVQQALITSNVAATTYSNGLLRLSLPFEGLDEDDRSQLFSALNSVA